MAKIPNPPEPAARPDPAPRMSLAERYRLQTWFLGIIAFGMVLILLVQAQFILTSLVFAIILFSLTSEAIDAFSRLRIGSWRIANWLATVAAFTLIAVVLLTLSTIVISQVNVMVSTAVAYADQAIVVVSRLAAWISPEAQASVETSIRSIQLTSYITPLAGQASNLLSATTLVLLFVGFLFAERFWFGTKLENLFHDKAQAERVARIIRSIARRVNHYLVVKTGISLVTGLAVYALLVFYGLEFAAALGILTFVLNYIPTVGSIVATVLVALLAFIQMGDPSQALLVFMLVSLIQFGMGSIVDPMLMGRALRVSAFAVMVALSFWGAVWGIPGMFLAVPILVAVMIICWHIPAARPVAVLISREGLPDLDDDAIAPSQPEVRRAAE